MICGILAKDWLPESGDFSTLMLIFYNTNKTTFSVDKITAYISDKFYIYLCLLFMFIQNSLQKFIFVVTMRTATDCEPSIS